MASPTKYVVKLSEEQQRALRKMIGSGKSRARKLIRARVLLKADESEGDAYDDEQIKNALEVSTRTIQRVRKDFIRGGFDAALNRKPQPARPDKRRLDGAAEARLIQLACSKVPDGHAAWTLDLLTERMIALNFVPADPGLSRDTVRRVLKKRAQALAERDVVHRPRAVGRFRLENARTCWASITGPTIRRVRWFASTKRAFRWSPTRARHCRHSPAGSRGRITSMNAKARPIYLSPSSRWPTGGGSK
jgi:transposase